MSRTRILYAISCFAVGAILWGLFLRSGNDPSATVVVGSHTIPVSIADTNALRSKGLSGTAALPTGTGMLFVFDTPAKHGFWMKDMHYPLDIVWIDSLCSVLGVVTADPQSYPEIFYPPTDVSYVLELNAGEASSSGMNVGIKMQCNT